MKCQKCGHEVKNRFDYAREKAKKDYPRAFEPWSMVEDDRLESLVKAGKSLKELVELLERQPSAIQRRIDMFGFKPSPVKPPESSPDPMKYVEAATAQE